MRFYPCAERSRRQIALQLAAISLRQHLYIIGTITYALNRSSAVVVLVVPSCATWA